MRPISRPPPRAGPISRPGRMGKSRTDTLSPAGLPAPTGARGRKPLARPAKPVLAADQSAALRDRLIAELGDLQSADEAAAWAHRSLPAKNTLTAADAELVEAGFRARLAAFGDERSPNGGPPDTVPGPPAAQPTRPVPEAEVPTMAGTEEPRGSRPSRQDAPPSRQGPPQIRVQATVRRMRPRTLRCASSSLCAAACAGTQGQR